MDLYQKKVSISEESENMYKNYENYKTCFIILQKNIPQLLFCSSNGSDRFHCHAIKKSNKSKTNQWKKPRNCDVRYRR